MADLGTVSILVDVRGQPIVKDLAKDLNNVATAEKQVSAATQKVMADFKRMQAITAMLKKTTDDTSNSFQRFSAKELQQTTQRLRGFESSLANTRRGMGQMGMATQQVGYQVGDFLVQVQSGTNFMVAFGQQATQLVGILPAFSKQLGMSVGSLIGISSVLGIVIPLATAIGAAFMRTSSEADAGAQGLDTYTGALKSLTDEIQRNQEAFLQAKFGVETAGRAQALQQEVTLQKEIADSQTRILEIEQQLDSFRSGRGAAYINLALSGKKEELALEEENLAALQEKLQVIAAQNEAQRMLNGGLSVSAGIQKGLVHDKTVELRLAKEQAVEETKAEDLARRKKDAFHAMAGEMGAVSSAMFNANDGAASILSNLVGATNAAMGLRDALGQVESAASSRADRIASLTAQIAAVQRGASVGAAQAQAETAAQLAKTGASLDQIAASAQNAGNQAKKIEELEGSLKDLTKTSGGAAGGTKKLKEGLDDAAKAAEQLRTQLDAPLVSAVGSISDAFGNFVARGLRDFKGFVKDIIGSFKNMIAQMIAMAVKNRIMLSLGIGGVTGTAAAAGQVAGLGSAGGMMGSLGIGQGIAGLAGGTGFLGGAGNAIAGLGGGGAGFFSVGANAAAAGGGIASTIGALAPPLLAVAAVFAFFKKKTKELDSGLRVTVSNMDALVETFKTVQTTQFFGLSKKTTTTVGAADAEVANPITSAVSAIQSDILKMAGVLNIGSDAFKDFSYELNISLKGLTEEQAAAKVQEELTKVGDAFADLIPNISSFKLGAETTSQTLVRLFNSLQVANSYFGQLANTMFEVSLAGADLASNLIQAFGSMDAFDSSMSSFVQNFYSEAEQVAFASKRVTDAFKALGLAAPATATAFRNLVESLMRDVTAGVAGASATLAGVLATQQDVVTVDTYNAQQEAARQAAAQAARQAAEARREEQIRRVKEEKKRREQEKQQEEERIAQERYNLETQLLQLQGNTLELRRRELELLDPTNRGLQEMVWKLEDAQEALEKFGEADFATRVDYLRAVGLAKNAVAASTSDYVTGLPGVRPEIPSIPGNRPSIPGFYAGGMHMGGPRIVGESGPELEITGPSRIYSNQDTAAMFRDPNLASAMEGLRKEVSGLRSEQLQLQVEISKNVKRTYDIERKWDTDGLPPVRV